MRRYRASAVVVAGAVALALAGPVPARAATPPPNDNFGSAQPITGPSGSVDGNLAGATVEPRESPDGTGQPSIWYRWTAGQDGLVRFDSATGVYQADLWLYTGTALGQLGTPPADWCPPTPYYDHTTYVLHATAGTVYSIALTGYSATVDAGRTTLRWAPYPPPANDSFAAATAVTTLEPILTGNNCASTAEPGEPLDEYASNRTVWYAWTPTITVTESLPALPQHLIATVYSGATLGGLTKVARSAYPHGDYGAQFTARAGTPYRIQVDSVGNPGYGIAGPQTAFAISLDKLVPCNDAFSCASGILNDTPLPLTGTQLTDNVDATAEPGEPAHAGVAAAHSLWWEITPPVAATLTLSTAGSGFDTVLAVYTGTRVDALTRVTADDDAAGGGASRVTFAVAGGTTYRVAVDGKAGATGQVLLGWRLSIPPPRNDMFANATVLTGGQGESSSYTWSASKEAGEPAHEGVTGGRSVWWRFTPTAAARLRLTMGGDYTVMSVYRGSSVSALTRVAGDRHLGVEPIILDLDVTAGVTYSIAVDVTDLVYGPDVVTVGWTLFPPRPPNDDIAHAIAITGSTGSTDGHDVGATGSGLDDPPSRWGEPSTVFYKWTAPASGLFVFDTLTSDYDTYLWIYRGWGSALGGLPLASNDDDATSLRSDPDDFHNVVGADHTSAADLTAVSGQVYTIVVDGPPWQQGRFTLHWAPAAPWAPANDRFAAAQPLSGGSGTVTARLADSTGEPGEPGVPGEVCCSVWFTWTAPATGPVRFWTGQGAGWPLLSVYTGSTLPALSLVGENAVGLATDGARLDFTATGSTTYRIRLAVRSGDGVYWPATAPLRWGPPPAPAANDAFAAAVALSGGSGTVAGTAQWATREPGEPSPVPEPYGQPAATVWYRWTAPATGTASFWMQSRALGPIIGVYTGGSLTQLSPLQGIGTPGTELLYNGTRITFPVSAGVSYAIQVQGTEQIGAAFDLLWSTAPPPHDNLANALPLSGARGYSPRGDWRDSTIRATAEPAEPNHAPGRSPGATVWYRWTAPASGPVRFWVADANVASVLAAYSGAGYGSLVQLAHTDWDTWHELRFDAVAGQAYLVVADTGPYGGGALSVGWSQYPDQAKPTGRVVVNGGASSTTTRMVTLTLAGTDNVGVTGVLVSNSSRVDEGVSPDAGPQQLLSDAESLDGNPGTVRWSLTDLFRGGNNAGGTKTVYVQWRDEQGNWSAVASDSIVANLPPVGDTTPPTGSVTINAGAAYTVSPSVTLAMPASDMFTGVAGVRISNRPDTSGGLLSYGSTRDWTALPQPWSLADPAAGGSAANGTRAVYVQFRDGAGNWSPVHADTIVLDTATPAARAPVAAVAAGYGVGSQVPSRLTWSATDATSGVAGYQVQQSTDGGSWATLGLSGPLVTAAVRSLAAGHSYQYRVRAVDRAGLWSGWQYGPVLRPALYQETTTALSWGGSWLRYAVTGASGGSVRGSTQAGAWARFTASARSIGWVAVRAPNRGRASVYVDGVLVGTVDLYATTVQPARLVFVRSWTSVGTHSVTARVSGTTGRPRVEVDAFALLR